ncbi:hypothetical protein GQ53DRAFT_846417 [Thozetella sp. PMI_491]|nr:hypothetical protein GQ53DRAFT_846417 [Thozetella sp. PMI_491]
MEKMGVASVELVPMRQLAEARRAEDDWTGISDQAERRKRQTRLALRAYRKRKATQNQGTNAESKHVEVSKGYGNQMSTTAATSTVFIPPFHKDGRVRPARYLYPMSRDHLLPLIEYNVFRASRTNVLILGYLHLGSDKCSFGGRVPLFPNPYEGSGIPDSLKPTTLQQATAHPDWIDLLPSPRMRDNAIRVQDQFANSDLCEDILGSMVGVNHDPGAMIVAWATPWEASGWEFTEGFMKKWSFLVEGCEDLLESTNWWRSLRGEDPLSWALE